MLGWWGRLVAWLLVLGTIGVSVFFVWAYALQFGAEKTSRWLTSLVVTFLTSILVVEPIMVGFRFDMFYFFFKSSVITTISRTEFSLRSGQVGQEVIPNVDIPYEHILQEYVKLYLLLTGLSGTEHCFTYINLGFPVYL